MIHCAAGIHRTGTFAMALLILCGLSYEESLDKIK
jgi:protein-tyrosine phosphatase